MKTDEKIFSFVLLSLIILVCGCSKTSWFSSRRVPQSIAGEPQIDQSSAIEKRFNETSTNNPTVVESALDLSKKYALLSEQAAAMKQENQRYSVENRSLKERVALLEAELKQTKKDLTESTDLLISMRVELNNWKNNVIGFRDEMRQADSEELKVLLEILKILGGEIKADTSNSDQTAQPEVSKR